jgi:Putative mitochondrial precursor protein
MNTPRQGPPKLEEKESTDIMSSFMPSSSSSRRMAAFLEENELFIPEDDEGDED